MRDDVYVVIRSVGERTEAACRQILVEQIGKDNVEVIRKRPFEAAIRCAFERGIEAGLKWTLCVDADLLLFDDAVTTLLRQTEGLPDTVFNLTGFVWDRFYGKRKRGGPHLYRTALLKKALDSVPAPGESLRPETYVKTSMAALGFSFPEVPEVLALHDYEQFYADIFRKMIVRGVKSPESASWLLRRADHLAARDKDFLVASWALRLGLTSHPRSIMLDPVHYREQIQWLLACNGLKEKEPLDDGFRAFAGLKPWHKRSNGVPEFSVGKFLWKVGFYFSRVGHRIQERFPVSSWGG